MGKNKTIFLTIDDLRFDAITPERMPNLCKIIEKTNPVTLNRCYSSSVSSLWSFISLVTNKFLGDLPANWESVKNDIPKIILL